MPKAIDRFNKSYALAELLVDYLDSLPGDDNTKASAMQLSIILYLKRYSNAKDLARNLTLSLKDSFGL